MLLDPIVCLSPFYTREGLTPAHVSPWMAGGSWAALSTGTAWGDVVSWDGLTPRGHQQTLLLLLGISGFQDTARGFNFLSSKKKGNLSRKCRDTSDTEVLLFVMRLFKNCQSGSQSAQTVKKSQYWELQGKQALPLAGDCWGLLCWEQNNAGTCDCWAKASTMSSQCIMLGRRP